MANQQLTRIERILVKAAELQSPSLANWGLNQQQQGISDWTQRLARKLASHSVVMIVAGEFSPELMQNREKHITDWVRGYARFHKLLAAGLFPKTANFHAQYADDKMPPVIKLTCDPSPIAAVMSGFITPYLAVRQPNPNQWSELELRGLMDTVLDELMASELPQAAQDQLRQRGIHILATMLNTQVKHFSATKFDRPILPQIKPQRQQPPPPPPGFPMEPRTEKPLLPDQKEQHALPSLPDSDSDSKFTPTERMFSQDIRLAKTGPIRLPPLPRPDDDKGSSRR